MGKLDDTGEYLPFAKKHLVLGKDNGDTNISLKSIWPEPNWQELCDDGLICSSQTGHSIKRHFVVQS
uniref:hypothetical protein n=1 Tax=Vibrio parahaemolyticus TaxID=670 RepID=UPI00155DD5D8|nr:hypothetical protein [Vibrio parahaemolyticus]